MRYTAQPKPSGTWAIFPVWTVAAISIAGLVVGILAGGVVVSEITSGWAAPVGEDPSGCALVDGRVTTVVDEAVETHHPFRTVAVPLIATLRVGLLRQGNPGVVVGRDRHLFTVEEIAWHPKDDVRLTERLTYIRDVHSRLLNTGVHLIVLLIPSKARIDAARLPHYLRASANHSRLKGAREGLSKGGVQLVDGAKVLHPEHYFARDTHWTPVGAAVVAEAVAPLVAKIVGVHTQFELRKQPEPQSAGDLLSFTPVGVFSHVLGLEPEIFHSVTAVAPPSAAGRLFATPEIPVALVGTSYSADARWSFAAQLRAQIGMDILEVAQEGVGPFMPMETYLSGETFVEIRPKLVIWEIPERYLTLPETAMPQGLAAEQTTISYQ